MQAHTSLHALIAWAKTRLDEMDSGLTAMEREGATVKDKAREAAAKAMQEARAQREAFAARLGEVEKSAAGELADAQRRLNEALNGFEAGMARWAEAAERQGETLALRARHQLDAWQALADRYRADAAQAAAAQRAKIMEGVAELEKEAAAQRQRLAALEKAGAGSWQAMTEAMAQTRRAFDEAAARMRHQFDAAWHQGAGGKPAAPPDEKKS